MDSRFILFAEVGIDEVRSGRSVVGEECKK